MPGPRGIRRPPSRGWILSRMTIGRFSALATLAADWCAVSPEDAAHWVDSRLGNPEGSEVVDGLIGAWGEQDPAAAAKWVMRLDEAHQNEAAATLISLWGANQPEVAAEWVARFPDGETRSSMIPALAEVWAGSEPVKAVEWSLGLPESAEKSEAVEGAFNTWGSFAPEELKAWLAKQPPGPQTEHLRKLAGELPDQ